MNRGRKSQTAEPKQALPDSVVKEREGEVHVQQRSLPEQGLQSEYMWHNRGAPPLKAEERQHEPPRPLPIHKVRQGPD